MSVYLYDEALVSKIKYWTEKTQLHVFGVDEIRDLFQVIADENKDKPITLPILTITRPKGYKIINSNKQPTTYNGIRVIQGPETASMLAKIPIDIQYQFDIYTRFQKEADMYMRNLVFNIINYPTLSINIPYRDINFKHNANIRITSDVMDTSNNSVKLFNGQFTRLSVTVNIDDAYLWDLRVANNLSIEDDNILYVRNPDKTTFTKETINID
jgi:hypothetical protein